MPAVPPTAKQKRANTKGNTHQHQKRPVAKPQQRVHTSKPQRRPMKRAADAAGHPAEPVAAPDVPPKLPTLPRPMDRQREKTVTVKEAAFRLGKSSDAIYLWLRTGRLRGWQPGGRYCSILVLESSIEEALMYSFEQAGAGRFIGRPVCL